ncbi:hypothetical protein INT45_010941 [Circinella minor]|uniref:Uncharacterized protein n=1 Tax=Circinella minor TaxID=1195481 RepID=A0A8H7RH57_9FUNG|nr:hypothetical protein INT45_010941 [Circinella minor]
MNNDDVAPEWAHARLQQLHAVEQQFATTATLHQDPNVTVRNPGADFTPTEQTLVQYPFIQENFFNVDNFFLIVPRIRSTIMIPLRSIRAYKTFGLVLFQTLHGNLDDTTIRQQSSNFAQAMHELLSDLALYITTLHTDNLYKGLPNHIEAPGSHFQKHDQDKQYTNHSQRHSAENTNYHSSSSHSMVNNGGLRPLQQSQQQDFHPRQSHKRSN